MASGSSDDNNQMSDARLVSFFVEKIIKPYLENNTVIDRKQNVVNRIHTKEDIENAIRLKVIQMNPMLQDCDKTREKLQTKKSIKINEIAETDDDTDDETTIIEFVPKRNRNTNVKTKNTKQDIEKNIERYKQLKQNITLLLGKENTSILTNKLITKTIDEMLSLLIEGQCKWKSVDTRDLLNQLFRNTHKSMKNLTDKELDQYKLTCYMRSRNKVVGGKPGFRRRKNILEVKNKCDSFKVCSDELRRFLNLVHKDLNDTAVSTFTNYAAMYIRDIKEKTALVNDDITSLLDNSIKSVENIVSEEFLDELEHFTLDTNKNRAANIEHISNFITVTSDQTKSNLSRFVDDQMSTLEIKFIKTIVDDLKDNLKMDIDKYKQQFKDKICDFFALGNHDTKGTNETKRINKLRARHKDSDNVYVKVQLSFDDELKNSLLRFGGRNLISNNTYELGKRPSLDKSVYRKQYTNVNVTRTTISSTFTTDGVVSSENVIVDQFF